MKVLFLPFCPTLARITRCLHIAELLKQQGHQAIFAIGKECIGMIQKAGFQACAIPEIPFHVFRPKNRFEQWAPDPFRQSLEAELALIKELRPDLVIYDYKLTARVSAKLAGIPSISISHSSHFKFVRQPFKTSQSIVGPVRDLKGNINLKFFLMRYFFPLGFIIYFRYLANLIRPVLSFYGYPPVTSLLDLTIGDHTFIASLPSMCPLEIISPHCTLVGPLLWSGWNYDHESIPKIGDPHVIYVSLGVMKDAENILSRLLPALSLLPYKAVICTNGLNLPNSSRISENINLYSTVPGARIIQQSCLAIHHGGQEAHLQAISAGVPSLVLPTCPDQIINAFDIVASRTGRSLWRPTGVPWGKLSLDSLTPDEISAAISDLIEDQECQQACAKLRVEMVNVVKKTDIVGILEKWIKK